MNKRFSTVFELSYCLLHDEWCRSIRVTDDFSLFRKKNSRIEDSSYYTSNTPWRLWITAILFMVFIGVICVITYTQSVYWLPLITVMVSIGIYLFLQEIRSLVKKEQYSIMTEDPDDYQKNTYYKQLAKLRIWIKRMKYLVIGISFMFVISYFVFIATVTNT